MNMHILDLSVTLAQSSGGFFRGAGAPGVSLIGKLIELLPPMEVEELDKISLTLVYSNRRRILHSLCLSLFI